MADSAFLFLSRTNDLWAEDVLLTCIAFEEGKPQVELLYIEEHRYTPHGFKALFIQTTLGMSSPKV